MILTHARPIRSPTTLIAFILSAQGGSEAEVISYSWQFVDEYGVQLSPSVLANKVSNPTKGGLQFTGLRAFKDQQGYHAVGGRCLATVVMINGRGLETQRRYASEYFHIIVRDETDPKLPIVPEDSKYIFDL